MITRYAGTPEIFAFISQSTFLMDLINHLCSNSVVKIDQCNSFAETFVFSNLSGVGLITTLKQNPPTKNETEHCFARVKQTQKVIDNSYMVKLW